MTSLRPGIACLLLATVLGCASESAGPPATFLCVPFEKSCEDGIPMTCNATGTFLAEEDPCEEGLVCEEGECRVDSSGTESPGEEGGEGDATDSDVEAGCTLNSDCVEEFADSPCLEAICNKGECIGEALEDGTECPGGICLEAACVEVVCEQGVRLCAGELGVEGTSLYVCNPLGTDYEKDVECDDGDACNGVEGCADAACTVGESLECSDDNPCTSDGCEAAAGCVFEALVGPCDDNNACTNGDGCINGQCVGGLPLSCTDTDKCTIDECDPTVGCKNTPVEEGGACNDDNACTEGETCNGGLCGAGAVVECDGGAPEACTVYLCDPGVGCEEPKAESDGVGCDDGVFCSITDACVAGTCTGVGFMNCDDGDQCTVDSCVEGSGCTSVLEEELACDDGDPCTGGDTCQVGVCEPGNVVASNECGMPLDGSCLIAGTAGSIQVCPVLVARKHSAVPFVTSFQFDVGYETSLVSLVGIEDEVCVEEECADVNLESAPLSTGHSLAMNPATIAEWDGTGRVVVSLFGEPVALNDAYVSVQGDVIGDAHVFNVLVELSEDISEAAPTYLYFSDIYASNDEAKSMSTYMKDGLVVVTLATE